MSKAKWPKREVILLLERLGSYISSGLSVDRAFQVIEEDCGKRQKKALRDMRMSIEAGRSLADSLGRSVRFPLTALSVLMHGESSGRLAQSLESARMMLEEGEELKKKLASALAYPVVIGIFALAITLGLVRGVMPQIIPMLESLHVRLPLLTRIVIAFSRGLASYGLAASASCMSLAVILIVAYKKRPRMRSLCQRLLMKAPLVGRLCVNYNISLFLRSCGTLIETGSPAGASYARGAASVALLPLREAFESKNAALNKGEPIHTAFKQKAVPSFVPSLLSAGEMSGTLGLSMIRAAAIIDRDIDHALKRLTALVEPLMMAGMGAVVGATALSIMMPIYDISKVLQR